MFHEEEAGSMQRSLDPHGAQVEPDAYTGALLRHIGSLEQDGTDNGGIAYFDKIILAGRDNIEPEGTITVVKANGTAETRRPDGTITESNPFPPERVTYSRRWIIMSSNELNPADRRLTVAVRVKSENAPVGKTPELVDLFTVMTNQ